MFNLRKLLALFSPEPLSPYDAALRNLAHGRPQAALDMLDRLFAEEADPAVRARLANKRGVALVALARRDDARSAFGEADEMLPGYAPALVNLGNLELEAGNFEEAVACYTRAIAGDGQYAPAYRHLGLAYKRMGRGSDAFAAFSKARRLEGRAAPRQSKRV